MREDFLRRCLQEAEEKEQIGLIIWPNERQWDKFGFNFKPGNEDYEFCLSQVMKGKEATCIMESCGFEVPGIIAVSVKRMSYSEKFFKRVLEVCSKNHLEGPITLIPLNELSEHC